MGMGYFLTRKDMKTTEKDIELFDSYMNGTMSDIESAQFEKRLRKDEAYRKEYELHSQIVLGIQRKELKVMLQKQENLVTNSKKVTLADRIGEWKNKIFVSLAAAKRNDAVQKIFVSLAAAACVIFGVFIVHDVWKMSLLGGGYIAQLEQPVVRGSGVEETLSLIYDDLQQGNYAEAQENIDKARKLIFEEQSNAYTTEEETEYHQQMLKLDSDELDWYQALLYAKTHKLFKAKRLLKQIAKSDSEYKEKAKAML